MVNIGQHSIYDDDIESFAVKHYIVHPNFSNKKMLRFDFLLLFLDGVSSHEPIQLLFQDDSSSGTSGSNSNNYVPLEQGTSLYVMGFGRTNPSIPTSSSTILQEVEVKYVPNDQCEASTGFVGPMVGSYNGLIDIDHICATDKNEDACYGDSGSPLILKATSGDNNVVDSGMDVLVGTVSWGFACVHNDFPGVYGRVSTVYDWIKDVACTTSQHAQDLFHCQKDDADNFFTVEADSNDVQSSLPSMSPVIYHRSIQDENDDNNARYDDRDIPNQEKEGVLYNPFCTNDSDCPSDSLCAINDHKCKKKNSITCFFNSECLSDKCNNGICKNSELRGEGMFCLENNQCESNKCKKDVCVKNSKKKKRNTMM